MMAFMRGSLAQLPLAHERWLANAPRVFYHSRRMSSLLLDRRRLLGGLGGLALAAVGRAAQGYDATRVADGGRIIGTVRCTRAVGAPAKLTLGAGAASCRGLGLRSEELLVTRGRLRNAVLYLEGIARGKETSTATVTIAEHRCTFVPHVLSVTVGTKLLLHNRDPWLNTFHAVDLASGRTLFNIGTPNLDQKVLRRVRQEGVIRMLCDPHPWEVAYVLAFPHPYHAISDAAGGFVLDQIPAGSYTLACWHEKLGVRRQTVKVAASAPLKVEMVYS
jgi:hypothetical protein